MDRRTFLGRAAVAGTALVGAGIVGWQLRERLSEPPRWDEGSFAPPGPARVALMPAASYDVDLESIVLEGLRAIEADVEGARVLLKPNFVEFDAGTSINTDPRLVVAAVAAFRTLGAASVVVGEGPGHRRDTMYVAKTSGLAAALEEAGAPFVDLNLDEVVASRLRTHYTQLGKLWLPRTVAESDVVVSMPKMKTHHWAGVTLSLKNCFGCVPGRVYGWPKNALHFAGLDGAILDVASAVRPDLAIIDGVVGMEGNGPINGTEKHVGVVVVADDPVAADATAARVMGVDPDRILHIAEAGRFLGQSDPDRIALVAEELGTFESTFAPAPASDGESVD